MLTFDEASIDRYTILKEFAHKNRLNMTMAERILWDNIRQNQLGHKFLRQYIIGDYIADFVALEVGLIIEVDGSYHSEPQQEEDDERRTRKLKTMGFDVIRFTNEDVLYNTNKVIDDIIQKLQEYE